MSFKCPVLCSPEELITDVTHGPVAGASKLALTSRRSLDGYFAKASFGAPTPIRAKASFGAPTPIRAKASFGAPCVTSVNQ